MSEYLRGTESSISSPHGNAPLRILCVEDNEAYFVLLREYLREEAIQPEPELVRAGTLAEAVIILQAVKDSPPFDIVLLDLSLPDSTGVYTFDEISRASPDTPITVLSGTTDRELALTLVQHGAQDYLLKDEITGGILLRAILYARERHRLRLRMRNLNDELMRTSEELRNTQMHLIQAEKLDSLGRIAAGVAHEVKNPLATLQMGIDYCNNRSVALGEGGVAVLKCMQEAIDRADSIVREMLDFSRAGQLQMRPCPVNELLEGTLRLLSHEMVKRKITIVEELTEDIPEVKIDRGKIEQVLINLLMNAAQAMPEGGIIKVRSMHAEIRETSRDEGLREMDRMRSGDEVIVIEVRDHGPGIPEDIMSRVFEPFFTTKPTGEGTGLGLSVSKRIVELHRGRLDVKNLEGPRGLRVRIILKALVQEEPGSTVLPEYEPAEAPAGAT